MDNKLKKDPCQKYLLKNKNNKYLLSFKTDKGSRYLGNYDNRDEACYILKEFIKTNSDLKILPKYCYY
tara:strand:- start:538 stop:741 length:204 start_codon:yes stop_codon:yes gene_type:complete